MSIPNTSNFSLQDVVDEINPTTDDLIDCISDANNNYYNTSYYTSPATSLLEFRDYGSHNDLVGIIASPDNKTWDGLQYGSGSSQIFSLTISPDATFNKIISGDSSKFVVSESQTSNTITAYPAFRNDIIGGPDFDATITVTAVGYSTEYIYLTQVNAT